MNTPRAYERHYTDEQRIPASPSEVFAALDDHTKFSSHMAKSSWRTLWSTMDLNIDEGGGRRVGSHIKMDGRILGARLWLDEVVTQREPPRLKEWETVGDPHLIVIGNYRMYVQIKPDDIGSRVRVTIDYDLPTRQRWRGRMLGGWYARWCVRQMTRTLAAQFASPPSLTGKGSGTGKPT